jgi:ketosteroid isomerase-like protein
VDDLDDLHAANEAFYAAFEARDLDAMSEIWEHSDRVRVTHPGWPPLQGWARVVASWEAIFANTPFLRIVLADEHAEVVGDAGWVTVDEHLLQGFADGADEGATTGSRVAATNVFTRGAGGWHLVVHHGSPVADV